MAWHAADPGPSFVRMSAMQWRSFWAWGVPPCLLILALAGCGTPGAPQPPSLNLPDPVIDLSAVRTGAKVDLTWTMPKKSTDKLILKDSITVRVCRKEGAGPCNEAGTELLAPGADASWSEALPPALDQGTPRTLTYFVELKNSRGRSAGQSNGAIVLAGAPPAPVTGLSIEMRKQGALVHWTPDDESTPIRLKRTLLTPPRAKPKEGLTEPPPEPVEQNLLIEDVKKSQALDKTVRFGETYEYRAQRVSRITADGKTLELAGDLSAPVKIEAADVFPPAVPTGLVAVITPGENGSEGSIDLSWEPGTEPDMAGYRVYRREDDGAWNLISPAEPLVGPAFQDPHVQPGRTYHYAVSAVDRGGHESARSAETQETMPNP
jgi:hypothetical protein